MSVTVNNPVCPHCHIRSPLTSQGKCSSCGKKPDAALHCKIGVARPKQTYFRFTAHDGSGVAQ